MYSKRYTLLDELRVTSCQTWHPWWSDRSAMTSSECPAGGSRGIDGSAGAAAVVVSSAPALVRTASIIPRVRIAVGQRSRGRRSGEHPLHRDALSRFVEDTTGLVGE